MTATAQTTAAHRCPPSRRLLAAVVVGLLVLPRAGADGGSAPDTPEIVLAARLKVDWDTDTVTLQAEPPRAAANLRLDPGRDRPAGSLPAVQAAEGKLTLSGSARAIFAARVSGTRSLRLAADGSLRVRLDLPPLDVTSVTADKPEGEAGCVLSLLADGLLPGFALSCSPQEEGQPAPTAPVLVRTDSRRPARLLDVSAREGGARLRILLPPVANAADRLTYHFTLENRDGSRARTVVVERRGDELRERPGVGPPSRPAPLAAPARVPSVELLEVGEALAAARRAGLVPVVCELGTLREVPAEGLERLTVLRQGLPPNGTARKGDVLLLGVRTTPGVALSPTPPDWARPRPGGVAVNPNAVDVRDGQGFIDVPGAPTRPGGGGLEEPVGALPAGLEPDGQQAVVPIAPDPGVNIDPVRPPDAVAGGAVLKLVLQALTTPGADRNLPGPLTAVLNEAAALAEGVPADRLPADRILGLVVSRLEVQLPAADLDRALAAWRGFASGRSHPQLLDANGNGAASDDVVVWFVAWLHQNGHYDPARDVRVAADPSGRPVAVVGEPKRSPEEVKKDPPAIPLGPKAPPANASVAARPAAGGATGTPRKAVTIPQGPREASGSSTPDKVRVPRLVADDEQKALNYRDAVALLTRRGLAVRSSLATPSPAETVHAQDPKPDTFVAAGSTVSLSLGVLVPDLSGLEQDEAVKKLDALGLRSLAEAAGTEQTTDPKLDGRSAVIGQAPPQNQIVTRGTQVALTVITYRRKEAPATPTGPAEYSVPRLIGLSQASAEAALLKAGLRARVRDTRTAEAAEDKQAGQVLVAEQSEPAGKRVAADTVVAIDVVLYVTGKGVVPKLTGLTPAAATAALKAARLTGKVRENRTEEVAEGVVRPPAVVEQSEEAGTQVPRDRVVEMVVIYYVPRNDPQRLVPVLVGLTPRAAEAALRQARLAGKAAEPRTEETADPRLAGQVVVAEQSEAAGSRVAPDTVINLVLVQYRDSRAVVPKLVGLSPQAAEIALKAAGLVGRVRDTRTAEATDPRLIGQTVIVEQSEAPGARVARERSVEMAAVRYLESQAEVPNVVGQQPERAALALRAAGLGSAVRGTKSVPTTDPKLVGRTVVAEQSERPGARVKKGMVVQLDAVSYPDSRVAVPNLVGMSPEDAAAACRKLGLMLRVGSTVTKPTADRNLDRRTYIGSQSPAAGTKAVPATTVEAVAIRYEMQKPPGR